MPISTGDFTMGNGTFLNLANNKHIDLSGDFLFSRPMARKATGSGAPTRIWA